MPTHEPMSDLSDRPPNLADAASEEFAWPTPPLACYPAPAAARTLLVCQVEGVNGKRLQGRLAAFDPARGVVQLLTKGARAPLALRFEQLRRLRLLEPLLALPGARRGPEAAGHEAAVPFVVQMSDGSAWSGRTLTYREEPWGLFLFEPIDEAGTLRRTFVPRWAYEHAEVGAGIAEARVAHHTPARALGDVASVARHAARERRLDELLSVRQIVTADELMQAVEQQQRMPMVRIGQALTTLGFVDEAKLQQALEQQREHSDVPLGELLVRMGLVTRAELQTALARKMGYPMVDAAQFAVESEAVARLPYAVAARVQALPLVVRGGRLVVAMEDPTHRGHNDEIEFAAQTKVVPVLARAGTLAAPIARAYERIGAEVGMARAAGDSLFQNFEPGDASRLAASLEQGMAADDADDGPLIEQSDNSLVRLINSMILEAQAQGVSDIHVECPPGREKVRIRFRKDGRLRPYLELPPSYRSAVVARLKIMCDLDISERRKPQDGKIAFGKFAAGSRLELRVTTIPTHGNHEDVVLRLLTSQRLLALDELNLAPRNLEHFRRAVGRPYGMILCVGPTGSGKTTTLHSALGCINTPERKIWTAEDPIEITQPGLRQVQVNPRIDWTFAKALRAFLRADPDVIMVGEIRDHETAQTAIEASLTGHLVLSTLHTNSAAETVTRLLDMGMDPFNFADALLAVLAQRLVRRLCTGCRVASPATPADESELLHDYLHAGAGSTGAPAADTLLAEWRARWGSDGRLTRWHAGGCAQCDGSGYRGRTGIHELMPVTRTLRQMIQTGQRADALLAQALAEGMRTLRQDGIEKVLAGATSIDEVRAST